MALWGNEGKGLKGGCVLACEWTLLGGLMYMCLCVLLHCGVGQKGLDASCQSLKGTKAGSHSTYMLLMSLAAIYFKRPTITDRKGQTATFVPLT